MDLPVKCLAPEKGHWKQAATLLLGRSRRILFYGLFPRDALKVLGLVLPTLNIAQGLFNGPRCIEATRTRDTANVNCRVSGRIDRNLQRYALHPPSFNAEVAQGAQVPDPPQEPRRHHPGEYVED